MSATITADLEGASPASAITERFLRIWLDACQAFRAWERRHVELAEPDEKTLAQYRDALKWMLRLTRLLDTQVNDPDFPARHRLASEVRGRLIQLQYSWEELENPMSAAEANRLIARHFPDES